MTSPSRPGSASAASAGAGGDAGHGRAALAPPLLALCRAQGHGGRVIGQAACRLGGVDMPQLHAQAGQLRGRGQGRMAASELGGDGGAQAAAFVQQPVAVQPRQAARRSTGTRQSVRLATLGRAQRRSKAQRTLASKVVVAGACARRRRRWWKSGPALRASMGHGGLGLPGVADRPVQAHTWAWCLGVLSSGSPSSGRPAKLVSRPLHGATA